MNLFKTIKTKVNIIVASTKQKNYKFYSPHSHLQLLPANKQHYNYTEEDEEQRKENDNRDKNGKRCLPILEQQNKTTSYRRTPIIPNFDRLRIQINRPLKFLT